MATKREKEPSISEYTIFKPSGKNAIIVDYPELKGYSSFHALNNDDALFVWYYACPVSPYFKATDERVKIQRSIEASYHKLGSNRITKDQTERYLNGHFTAKIQAAIEDMRKFKIGPRLLTLITLEKGMQNLSNILNRDLDDDMFKNKDGVFDLSLFKDYAGMLEKATTTMPLIISRMEGNFGLTKKEGKEENEDLLEGRSLIDEFHENNND